MTVIESVNPATAAVEEAVTSETTAEEVASVVSLAAQAAGPYDRLGRPFRARLLRAIADALEGRREDIVALGIRETALAEARLNGELTRTCFQARLFADVVDEGSYLEATIDHAQETPMGPGPDLRRMLLPVGPVAVFGASNFPLAFSVPGGDTVSALAAGCPVVIKAHDSHPALSALVFGIMRSAAYEVGAPTGTLGIVFGTSAGAELVTAPQIRAVGFTGSLGGGKALIDLVNGRPDPIPFFGELASVNPVVLSQGAVASRSDEMVEGLVASITGSAGQLCTKPGIVFVPRGDAGDQLVATAVRKIELLDPFILLNRRMADSYRDSLVAMEGSVVSVTAASDLPGFRVPAALVEIDVRELEKEGVEETFGPLGVVVRYDGDEVLEAIRHLDGSLTLTVHAEPDELDFVRNISDAGLSKAGRFIHNAWPTGVLVSWAQTHGGPWPSTNSQHTSVGAAAIKRFLRPVTWQSAPSELLPDELTDDFVQIPRRIDGQLRLAGGA